MDDRVGLLEGYEGIHQGANGISFTGTIFLLDKVSRQGVALAGNVSKAIHNPTQNRRNDRRRNRRRSIGHNYL